MAISTDSILVALDAGHSLHTPGKRTPEGVREWSLNETVARGFDDEITKYLGVKTHRLDDETGQTDISLTNRTNIANQIGADYVISFHHNAFKNLYGNHGGTETWVQDRPSEELASVIHKSAVKSMGLRDRGIKYGNLHMNRESNALSCLVELGFMDSLTDKIILDDNHRYKVGKQMAIDFANYYGLKLDKPAIKPLPPVVKPKEEYITVQGSVRLFKVSRKDDTWPYGLNKKTSLKKRTLKVLDRDNGRVKVRIPNFDPEVLWLANSEVKLNDVEKVEVVKNKPSGNWVAEKGMFELSEQIAERNEPTTLNNSGFKWVYPGTKLYYDAYLIKGGYVWLRKVNDGKVIPWRVHKGNTWGKLT